jgi:uncharacterized coiled-coil protein SlyX
MDEKNLGIVLDALAEKIKSLELRISVKDHEIQRLNDDIKALTESLDTADRENLELNKIINMLEAKNGKKD